jgi:hypothetical protein
MAIVLHFMKEYLGFVVTLGPNVVGATCSKGVMSPLEKIVHETYFHYSLVENPP